MVEYERQQQTTEHDVLSGENQARTFICAVACTSTNNWDNEPVHLFLIISH